MVTTDKVDARGIAERLDRAWQSRIPIEPVTETAGPIDTHTAYGIQKIWEQLRRARGERIIGRKIGLTSEAIRAQLKVSEPDYGALWQSSFYQARDGRVTIATSDFLQPRIEGEVAFLVGERLRGPGITPDRLVSSIAAFALGMEIVDSRISDWRIKLADTIADNASYGGFSLGPWDRCIKGVDFSALQLTVQQGAETVATGYASAVMGSPLISTSWLVNKLSEFDVTLNAGDVIISGGITKMLPVRPGDRFEFSLTGQPSLEVCFI